MMMREHSTLSCNRFHPNGKAKQFYRSLSRSRNCFTITRLRSIPYAPEANELFEKKKLDEKEGNFHPVKK